MGTPIRGLPLIMMGARKFHLLTGLKADAVGLRSKELDFHLQRYMKIGSVSSITCFLVFNGIIKIAIPVRRPTPASASQHSIVGGVEPVTHSPTADVRRKARSLTPNYTQTARGRCFHPTSAIGPR